MRQDVPEVAGKVKTDALAIPDVAKKLDAQVLQVIGSEETLAGFEKAYQIATAAQQLKNLLTSEYMKPIMALQGNRLGFKTDKDDKGGYPEEVVKNCLIEAVLTGVQPWGNQFNIIAGNTYVTKEGFGHLLANFKGLKDYEIIPGLPRINTEKSGAAIVMKVKWTLQSEPAQERDLDISVKMNAYMGVDAVIGKATRKARAWLHGKISGVEIGEGDVNDIDHKVVGSKVNPIDKNEERLALLIKDATTVEELKSYNKDLPESLFDLYNEKIIALSKPK